MSPEEERQFWGEIRRGLLTVVAAIEKRYDVGGKGERDARPAIRER